MRPVRAVLIVLILAAGCSSKSTGEPATGSSPPPPVPVDAAAARPPDPRVARGAASYQKYCALCHGKDGTGYAADHAPSLVNDRLLRSADDAFLARSISLGRPATPMAGYSKDLGGPLGDVEIDELVAWMRDGRAKPEPLPPVPPGDAAAGAALYVQQCQKCHGDPTTRAEAIQLGHPTFLALASDAFLQYAIVHGRPGTPMEAFGGKLTPQQIADLVAHLRSWATPYTPPRPPTPPAPPPAGPVVINPRGKAPSFQARDGRFVPAAQVAAALKQKRKMVIVDARPPSDWLALRIPGAISVPHYEPAGLDAVPNDGTWVLAYCACPHHASGIIVDELRKRGYPNTGVIDEGILFWHQKGYPVDGTSAKDPPKAGDPHAGHNHGTLGGTPPVK